VPEHENATTGARAAEFAADVLQLLSEDFKGAALPCPECGTSAAAERAQPAGVQASGAQGDRGGQDGGRGTCSSCTSGEEGSTSSDSDDGDWRGASRRVRATSSSSGRGTAPGKGQVTRSSVGSGAGAGGQGKGKGVASTSAAGSKSSTKAGLGKGGKVGTVVDFSGGKGRARALDAGAAATAGKGAADKAGGGAAAVPEGRSSAGVGNKQLSAARTLVTAMIAAALVLRRGSGAINAAAASCLSAGGVLSPGGKVRAAGGADGAQMASGRSVALVQSGQPECNRDHCATEGVADQLGSDSERERSPALRSAPQCLPDGGISPEGDAEARRGRVEEQKGAGVLSGSKIYLGGAAGAGMPSTSKRRQAEGHRGVESCRPTAPAVQCLEATTSGEGQGKHAQGGDGVQRGDKVDGKGAHKRSRKEHNEEDEELQQSASSLQARRMRDKATDAGVQHELRQKQPMNMKWHRTVKKAEATAATAEGEESCLTTRCNHPR
jgi:hypothetical protein